MAAGRHFDLNASATVFAWPVANVAVNPFLLNLKRLAVSMEQYEDPELQAAARGKIPMVTLQCRAQERMRALQRDLRKGATDDDATADVSIQEMLVVELLAWFKGSFFEWVDAPECEHCDSDDASTMSFSHKGAPDEIPPDASSVEVYRCGRCSRLTPFYRYSSLATLLETREGRCGEWAAVFTLMCRALGWEARYVMDVTDHVWTEVFSVAQRRWLHCDPCEGTCDEPLMYESGWGKRLSYVIAFAVDDVQDVTWRYSADHSALLLRRNSCTETELVEAILAMRRAQQASVSAARRRYLTRRTLCELVHLMVEKKADGELQGRTSGSLAWRRQRNETGERLCGAGHIWRPTPPTDDSLVVRYSAAMDRYERVGSDGRAVVSAGWRSGTLLAENVFRKVEHDWNMVYLSRSEGAETGEVVWRFEAPGARVINTLQLSFEMRTYENGEALVDITADDDTKKTLHWKNESELLETRMFEGAKSLTVTARLSGGKGPCAWQHAQLFRQYTKEDPGQTPDYPFYVRITFKTLD